jgi:tetratricopeptide (TPR) repeat protein
MLKKLWFRLLLILVSAVLVFAAGNIVMEEMVDRLGGKTAYTYYLKGVESAAKGNFKRAKERFAEAQAMDKRDYLAQSALEVLADLNRGIISKKYTACLFKGISLLEDQQYPAAAKEFQRAVKMSPGHYRGYNCLAMVYRLLDRHRDAIACYEKAIQLKPDYAKAYGNLGNLYFSLKEYQQALTCVKKAIALNPSDAKNYYNLGMVYEALGNTAEAKKSLDQARKLSKS